MHLGHRENTESVVGLGKRMNTGHAEFGYHEPARWLWGLELGGISEQNRGSQVLSVAAVIFHLHHQSRCKDATGVCSGMPRICHREQFLNFLF